MALEKIVIACDHAGVDLKDRIVDQLQSLGHEVVDCGTNDDTSVDYPDYADKVVLAIENDEAEMGVLICGTGVGISIAANRHRKVRAALCYTPEVASLAREHNNANVAVFGARFMDETQIQQSITNFFSTEFAGGRHQRRVEKMS